MRNYVWMVVLAAGLVLAGSVGAQDDASFERDMHKMELQKKQMELQQYHAELELQNEMRKLELEKKRAKGTQL